METLTAVEGVKAPHLPFPLMIIMHIHICDPTQDNWANVHIQLHLLHYFTYLAFCVSYVSSVILTGLSKTGHICTNYTSLENDTFLGHCLHMIKVFCKLCLLSN